MPQSTVTFLCPITKDSPPPLITLLQGVVPRSVGQRLVPFTFTWQIPDEYAPFISLKLDIDKEALVSEVTAQNDDTTKGTLLKPKFPPIYLYFNPTHPHHWLDLANSINAWFDLPKFNPQSPNYDDVLDAFWMCVVAGSPGLCLGDNWEEHARGVSVRCRFLRRLVKYTEIGTSLQPYNLHRHWIELQDLLNTHFTISYYG
ncbi:hypothetical protein FRC03_006836 [Tulasnella sp. 419]|nr:hypothetical protein FRC02_009365 [Tulasnella sp. 418]KAG8960260.1 hypothetical protein FRC03_006836 [Tulasnella sp. 419]